MDYSQLSPVKPVPVEQLDSPERPQPQPHKSWRKTLISILYKVQKYSAYGFMGFLGLHGTSVILFPGAQLPLDICQDTFEMARLVYLAKPMEMAIATTLIAHVMAGVSIRMLRWANKRQAISKKEVDYNLSTSISQQNDNYLVDTQLVDESHGLGGITSLIGLGSRKAIISNLTGLTPLAFSGYCLIPLILFHVFKFRLVPTMVDEDSLLVTLQYVNVVLNESLVKWGNSINLAVLGGLIWTGAYHFTSGTLKFQRKTLDYYKKLGYTIISGVSILGLASLLRLKYFKFDNGYLLKKFINYINFSRI